MDRLKHKSSKNSYPPSISIFGIGNTSRRDDGVGLLVARKLRTVKNLPAVVREVRGDISGLLELWRNSDAAVIIDAVRSGAEAGMIHRFDLSVDHLYDHHILCSTHSLGLKEVLGLGQAIGQIPPRVIIYGIEIDSTTSGRSMNRSVRSAAAKVIPQIRSEIENLEEVISGIAWEGRNPEASLRHRNESKIMKGERHEKD